MRASTLLVLVLTALLAGHAFAAEPPHALVEIDLTDSRTAELFWSRATQYDVVQVKPGSFAHLLAAPDELQRLQEAGLAPRTLVSNMEAASAYGDKGVGFGIYHTWSEGLDFLDNLRLLYPDVVSAKWSIGQSLEGRDIWALRISDNPDVDENEPEILFDSMHHSREIMSSEFVLMFAEHLAQNYGTDPEITWLVDNRELYLVPFVNPDGVVYNELTNPNGGGMWRKNRRDNGDTSMGVDLNRNYSYQWGYDDVGSSPSPGSQTYRGTAPASEPETQAMVAFINGREIRVHDSIHTYSNLVLYPWGYTSAATPDALVFTHMAAEMTKFNGYIPGQPGAILYSVNGDSFDWTYGASGEHAKILSVSTEIGSTSDGFWPSEARREPLFQENLWPHIYLMRAAGVFIEVRSPVVSVPAKSVLPGEAAEVDLTVENQSVIDGAGGLDLTLRTDDPWIQFDAAQATISSLPAMGTTTLGPDAFPFTVDPACPDGHLATFRVTAGGPGGDLTWPLNFPVGSSSVVFADDFESGAGNWTLEGTWALTGENYNSAATSLTDSPGTSYADQTATAAVLDGTYRATALTFWHRFDIESGYDYGKVQVSADGGPWETLASYSGLTLLWQWVNIDLTAYAGRDLAFRFLLETDYSITEDGWHIDDVTLMGLPETYPDLAVPTAASPVEGQTTSATPTLTVAPGAGTTDPTVYGFRIFADALCTQVVASVDDVPAGLDQTSWTAPALATGDYWWRAYGGDGTLRTPLTPPIGFSATGLSPVDGAVVAGPALRILGSVSGGTSRFELNLPVRQEVAVDVFDARGARIRRLVDGSLASGPQILVWDGRDDGGRAAASGVYFVRVVAGRDVLTDRVVLVR